MAGKMQGYGCMGLSAFYASARSISEDKAVEVFHHAVNEGVTLFNSATFYGPLHVEGFGHNLRLINKCLKGVDRSKIQLMVKIGLDTRAPIDKEATQWNMSGKMEYLRADVEYALAQLGVDYIDIIVLCRVPHDISIQEAVKNMKVLVDEGKARHIALSEASAATIRLAAAVTSIYAIEQEWSVWSRDIEAHIVPTCRELGIRIIAYSPLGRGFLTGTIRSRDADCLDAYDYRLHGQPRLTEANIGTNLALVDKLQALAVKKGITVGQLALAWLHSQGDDVIPIPGTSSIKHFDENYAALRITLTTEELDEVNRLFPASGEGVVGGRYPGTHFTFADNMEGA